MTSIRIRWTLGVLSAGALALGTPTAEAVRYCTAFNDGHLTRVLSQAPDQLCPSDHPCNFYNNTFSDARENCGDEIFRVTGSGQVASCQFCFWSECASVNENEFGVVPLDEVAPLAKSPEFRMRVLTAPSAQAIFRGGPAGDEPPATTFAMLDVGRDYLFYLIQNATRTEALADHDIPVFFSVAGANPDLPESFDHLISLASPQNGGAIAFGWEDLLTQQPQFDNDLNDVVFTTRCALQMRPSGLPRPPSSRNAPR